MVILRSFAETLATWGERLGVVGVMVLVGISCADVVGAKLFNMPVKGATEVISLVQLAMITCVLGSTQMKRGHVSVDMFVQKMPPSARRIVELITSSMSLFLVCILIWQTSLLGMNYFKSGEVTGTVLIPFYPFAFCFSMSMVSVAIILFCDIVNQFKEISG